MKSKLCENPMEQGIKIFPTQPKWLPKGTFNECDETPLTML